jgi:hypothetical protein
MKLTSEGRFVNRHEYVDDTRSWNNEAGYYRGLGEDVAVDSSSWVDAFKEVLPAVASVYQQDQFNKMNIALINAGKPPVNATQYMATQPVTARVGLEPTDEAKKWIVYAGLGILALVGLRAARVI